MRAVRFAALTLALAACLATPSALPQSSARVWLDRYAAGDFMAVAAELDAHRDFKQLLDDLKTTAPAWLDAGGAHDRRRRELAATTFALEAARVASWREWKLILAPPKGPDGIAVSPLPTLYWRAAPLLIEWGCALWRASPEPQPLERTWQLAAAAVAQRAEDPQFLIGLSKIVVTGPDPDAPPPPRRQPWNGDWGRLTEILNKQDEIRHLEHTIPRFPGEARLRLADAIARDQVLPDEARIAYQSLLDDIDVGGEAHLRLAGLQMRGNRVADALRSLDRAEAATRDPFVIHLTRLSRARILVGQQRDSTAIDELRAALAAWPGAQSASVLLADLLVKAGRRAEAQAVAAAVLSGPSAADPYLEHMHGDDRFWPELLSRLQREIRP